MRTNTTVLKSLQLYKDMCRKMSLGLLSVFYDLSAHFVKKKIEIKHYLQFGTPSN